MTKIHFFKMSTQVCKVQLTPASALDIIKPFFQHSWSTVGPDAVVVEEIKGGYCNTIYKVSGAGRDDDGEPQSLILRIKGGNMIDVDTFSNLNTYNTITIVTYEMSRR